LNLLQKEIFSIIKSSPKINTKFKDVINNFDTFNNKLKFFDFENSSNEDLNDFFEDLHIISKNIKDNINNYNDSNKENIINNLDNLNKNIDFMNNLKSTVFLQIPLNINNFSTTAELIVFSNKKNKNTASKNNSGSALLSLNLLYLGKLEVFINKINNDISCQFRLENDNTQFLVKDNIDLLSNYLINKNLNLKDVTFKSLDESFSLVNITPKKKSNLDFKLSNFNVKA
uniref:flagellar hook-length control protein FliK n=1 Tax=uncultured Tyzzerella sp. TaxID=2321398 RepID=UPI002942AE74